MVNILIINMYITCYARFQDANFGWGVDFNTLYLIKCALPTTTVTAWPCDRDCTIEKASVAWLLAMEDAFAKPRGEHPSAHAPTCIAKANLATATGMWSSGSLSLPFCDCPHHAWWLVTWASNKLGISRGSGLKRSARQSCGITK